MTFEDWWMQLHPAEVDELKPVFEDCWKQAQREELVEYATIADGYEQYNARGFGDYMRRMAEELK